MQIEIIGADLRPLSLDFSEGMQTYPNGQIKLIISAPPFAANHAPQGSAGSEKQALW